MGIRQRERWLYRALRSPSSRARFDISHTAYNIYTFIYSTYETVRNIHSLVFYHTSNHYSDCKLPSAWKSDEPRRRIYDLCAEDSRLLCARLIIKYEYIVIKNVHMAKNAS